MKILVCDDIESRGDATLRAIQAATGHQVELLVGVRLTEAIEDLLAHARSVLKSPNAPQAYADDGPSAFRQPFDMAILDNNLSELRIAGARHTAESIAGYVRAFGKIPYLVSLNKNPHVDFDLRYLVGDYQTQADIALNDTHLSNPGLWTARACDAANGFLPWYWPALNDAPRRRQEQVLFVVQHLDQPILHSLEFPATASDYLSRHAMGALSPQTEHVESVTFLTFFVEACRSLPNLLDRETLSAAVSEDERGRHVVARVVAAEVERWIRRDLLGPQDVLVDIPHLLARMPFLLGPHGGTIQYWNEAIMATEPPYGLWSDIYREHLHEVRFADDIWTKGPCFWWRHLKANAELNRMFYHPKTQWADVFFCEDSSRFVRASDGDNPATVEFAAEFEGSWSRRHIEYLPKRQYAPKSRLAK